MTENISSPKHGSRSNCGECGEGIQYVEYSQWAGTHYEILDAWWSHDRHPKDDHDAFPMENKQ